MSFKIGGVEVIALAVAMSLAIGVVEAGHVIKIGGNCDRTGSTKVIGVELCPGVADYIAWSTRRAACWDIGSSTQKSTTLTWWTAQWTRTSV